MFGLSNPCVTRGSSLLMISESLGLFALSNPCVTLGSSLVDDFLDIMGSLRFRIHEAPVGAVC